TNNLKDDLLKEKEAEDRNLNLLLSKLEQLSKNSQFILGFKMKWEKLFLSYEDLRLITDVGVVQVKTGQWKAELRETEKGLLEVMEMSEQTIQELSGKCNLDSFPMWQEQKDLMRINQEKGLEIAKLKKNIERIEAEHKTTKEILSFHLEEVQFEPVVEPKIADTMEELQSETYQLNISKDNNLEEEIKPHPKIIEDQRQNRMQLLPPLQDKIERLIKGIKELEIKELADRTLSTMDQLSEEDEIREIEQDVRGLQQQQQMYALARENNLKGEYHKMMAISIAKEADNLRIPDESYKLSNGFESHFQDMDEEATCKEDEMKFESIEEELAQIQMVTGQFCNTKDLLLVKLDLLLTQPSTESPLPAESEDFKAGPFEGSGRLKKINAGKDAAIQKLQEEHQKLTRKRTTRTNQFLNEAAEGETRCFTRLTSELLIKAKSDELLSLRENLTSLVDENEKWKQAVINLKERVLNFEIELCKLKQENEKIKEESKEKEGEMRALQDCQTFLSPERARIKIPPKKLFLFQQEGDAVTTALKNKQMEIDDLQSKVQYLYNKESQFNQELERAQNQAVKLQNYFICQAQDADEREANLRMKIMELEEKLHSSFTATENANEQAKILQDQLNVISKQTDELAAQLSTWNKKISALGALVDLKGHLDQAYADLELEEGKVEELKKQKEVIQEVLDEVHEKRMDLAARTERNVDESLMRGSSITIGSTLGIKQEEMESLLRGDPGGIDISVTGQFGSRNVPNTPRKPNESSMQKNSFSQLFVQFLQSETHESSAAAKSSAHHKTPDSVDPRIHSPNTSDLTVVSLVLPPGYEAGRSGNLLHEVAEAFPTYTHLLLLPSKNVGVALKEFSKQ
ncbi:LOW QUALITY PROTEIN: Thyroid receptor-interacting protein 11, partial [Galemys pyrenaicus]